MKPSFIRFAVCAFIVILSTRLQAATPPKPSLKLTLAETKAAAILRDVDATMKKHKTMTANFVVDRSCGARYLGSLLLMKPNYARVEYRYTSKKKQFTQTAGSDGKNFWIYPLAPEINPVREYSKRRLEFDEKVIYLPGGAHFFAYVFFGVDRALQLETIGQLKPRYVGVEQWNGASYRVLQHEENSRNRRLTNRLFVGRDNVVQRQIITLIKVDENSRRETKCTSDMQFSNVKFGAPLSASRFTFKVPAGVQQWKEESTK